MGVNYETWYRRTHLGFSNEPEPNTSSHDGRYTVHGVHDGEVKGRYSCAGSEPERNEQ